LRVLVVVPTLAQRRLEALAHAIADQCRHLTDAGHDAHALLLHNGTHDHAVEALARREGVGYATHVPRGYSQIRNEAIRRAVDGGFDVLAMIDDDELPSDGWLAALVAPFDHDADVVVGPVLTAWPEDAPARFVRSSLPRAAPSTPDGWIDGDLRSGSCAIRVAALGSVRFDEHFDATGGEDTALFRRLQAAGARCYWASGASVTELVDPERVRLRYFAQRSFAQGRSLAVIQRLHPQPGEASVAHLVQDRSTRAARLAWWALRRRNVGHLLESACEVAFISGYASRSLAQARRAAGR
jgi:hypothetical protein